MKQRGFIALMAIISVSFFVVIISSSRSVLKYNATVRDIQEAQAQKAALTQRLAILQTEAENFNTEGDANFPPFTIETQGDANDRLLSDMLDLAEQAGVNLTSFRSYMLPGVAGRLRIGVEIETSTSYKNFVNFLLLIEAATPPLGISRLSLRQEPIFDGTAVDTPVYVQMEIWALGGEIVATESIPK